MKKNLLTVIVLAICLVNLVMNALIMFTIVPETKQVNELITKIASAIDMELNTGYDGSGTTSVPIDQITNYTIADNLTINLKTGADGAQHMAVLGVTISMDNQHKDFEGYGSGNLSDNEQLIKATIISCVEKYTYQEMNDNFSAVKEDVLESLQGLYDSRFIIDVSFYYKVLT